MAEDDLSVRVGERLEILGKHALCVFIDACFLACWAAVQWGLDWVLHTLFPVRSPGDAVTLLVIQVLLSIATILPPAAYIYVDVAVFVIHARLRLRREGKLLYDTPA